MLLLRCRFLSIIEMPAVDLSISVAFFGMLDVDRRFVEYQISRSVDLLCGTNQIATYQDSICYIS